jgi:CheY-like chemotaxis protein
MNRKRILVVDDEVGITRMLKLNLERTGKYEVREENSGAAAVSTATEFQPDLIIMDVMMPDMDGGDVAASLREDPLLRKTPLIFLTGAVRREELGGPEGRIGGRVYLAKPLDLQRMLRLIEQTLTP